MYSKSSWGGDVEPYILARFNKAEIREDDPTDPVIAIAIFNWKDVGRIGAPAPGAPERVSIAAMTVDQRHLP